MAPGPGLEATGQAGGRLTLAGQTDRPGTSQPGRVMATNPAIHQRIVFRPISNTGVQGLVMESGMTWHVMQLISTRWALCVRKRNLVRIFFEFPESMSFIFRKSVFSTSFRI